MTRTGTRSRSASKEEHEKARSVSTSKIGPDTFKRTISLPDGSVTFDVKKGPLHGLSGVKIQKALKDMPNGGVPGGKPVSPKFKAAAAAAKAYGIPPKGVKVETWKNLSHAERLAMRKAERENIKAYGRSPKGITMEQWKKFSPQKRAEIAQEAKKTKAKRRKSGKAAAAKVKRVNSATFEKKTRSASTGA